MREYPVISQGLGKFTPDLFARLMDMLEAFESSNGGGKVKPGIDNTGQRADARVFVARISGSSAISGENNRFAYTFVEETADDFSSGSADYNFSSGGRLVTGTAYNIMEVNNTSALMNPGVDLSAGDFPSGMSVQPISTGSLVFMRQYRDNQGAGLYLFQAENAIDGSCS
jgi:hypothetical protein